MKTIDISKAHAPLAKYARLAANSPLVVLDSGKPIAALVPIGNADRETVSLSTNPKFLALIERSRVRIRAGGAIPAEEVRKQLTSSRRRKKK